MRVPLTIMIVFFLVSQVGSSCTGERNKEEVAQVDRMLITTDSLLRALEAVDGSTLQYIDSLWNARKDRIALLSKDTLTKEEALVVANYQRAMSGPLNVVQRDREGARGALELQRDQLKALRHDLQNDALDEERRAEYMQQEARFLRSAQEQVMAITESARIAVREHDRYSAHIDSLLEDTTRTRS
jgi:hypothetical protein